jgi:hypothetical protein
MGRDPVKMTYHVWRRASMAVRCRPHGEADMELMYLRDREVAVGEK